MIKRSLLLSFTILSISKGIAYGYDISDAISSVLNHNDSIKVHREELEVAKLGPAKVFTQFMPSVTYQKTYQSQDVPTSSRLENRENIGSGSEGFALKQNLFNGGQSFYSLQTAKENLNAAGCNYQYEFSKTLFETISTYQEVIATRGSYKVAIQKEESTRKIYEQVEIKVSIGTETKTALADAKAKLADSIASKQEALNRLKNSEAKFLQIVGEYPTENMNEIDANAVKMPASFEDFLELIPDNNLGIMVSKHQHKASRYDILKSIGVLIPNVDFEINSRKSKNNRESQYLGDTYQISLTVPIFQQGLEYVGIKEAKLKEKAFQYRLQDTTAKTISSAVSEWNNYQQSKVSIIALEEALEFQKFYLDGTKLEFEIGTKSLKDLLDAEVAYAEMQNRLIKTKLDLVRAAFAIHHIAGDLYKMDMLYNDKQKITKKKK